MKTLIQAVLFMALAGLITGCLSPRSASLGGGLGIRNNGNQLFTLNQRSQAPGGGKQAVPKDENTDALVQYGAIVNNFYIGDNDSKQDAGKTVDALKAAANTAVQGSGIQQTKSNASQQPNNSEQNNQGNQDASEPGSDPPVTE